MTGQRNTFQAGQKKSLLNLFLQSLPTYAMSVFKFSAGQELEQMIRNFWWGDEYERRKIHWLAWDKLTKSKLRGGVSYSNLIASAQDC